MNVRRALSLLLSGAAIAVAACDRMRDPPRPSAPIAMQLAVGESAYIHGALDTARKVWEDALARAHEGHDSVGQARALTWLGLAARRRGDHAEARRLGEEALALKLKWRLDADLSKSYNALGLLAWDEGRLTDALDLYTKAEATARAAGDRKALATVAGNLALVQTQFGEFAAARKGFLASRDGARDIGDARLEGNALNNLGMLDVWMGDPQAAIPLIVEARARYRSIDYRAGELNALGQLSTAYAALGEFQLAVAALDSALALARQLKQQDEEASALEQLARVHQESGDFHHALELFGQARRLYTALDQQVEVGNDLQNEAEIRASLGDPDAALRLAHRALELHQKTASHSDELGDRLLLADLYSRRGQSAEVRVQLDAARRLAARSHARLPRVQVALVGARIDLRSGDAAGALRALDSARADLNRGGYGTEWQAELLRSRALARLGRLDSAAASGRRAVAAVERARGSHASGSLRSAYLADKAEAYSELAAILLRLDRTEEAFAVSDQARGRTLGDLSASAPDSAWAAGNALLLSIDRLSATIDTVETGMSDHPDSAALALMSDLYERLASARSEYETVLAHQPGAGGESPAASRLDVAALRRTIGDDEVLLEYLVGVDSVRIFALTRTSLRAFASRASPEALGARARVARADLEHGGGPAHDGGSLAELYEDLLGPVERSGLLASARGLVIVPHDVITYFPFAALRREPAGAFLVETYAISYAPSAESMRRIRARAPSPSGAVAAAVFAPLPDELPFTRLEASAVANFLPNASLIIGLAATESAVRAALTRRGTVHVATHGAMNAANPLFSSLTLAPGVTGRPDDDGRLEVHELIGLDVQSQLVFLSGCETALGPAGASSFAPREDYATLAEAFLYAGAADVVATLWRVDDEGAAQLASRFYQHLASHAPADALALAQRDLIAQDGSRATHVWAAYGLWGAGGSRAAPQNGRLTAVK